MYFLLGGDMDLSTLIKYSHKNIKLIVVVVLCCAVLAGAVKILTDYTKYNEEKTNIEALQSEIDSLNSQKNNLLAEKSDFDGDERYKYIKGIDSASLQKYTTVYYIEKNVALYNTVINDINLLADIHEENNLTLPLDIVDIFIDFTASTEYRTLTIHVYGQNKDDLGVLKNIAEKCFERAKNTVSSTLGSSIIMLISERESLSSNTSLTNMQKAYNTEYAALEKSISEIDKQIMEKQSLIDKVTYEPFNKESIQYSVLGLILGVFLAYVLILGRFYLSRKLIGIEQLPKLNLFSSGTDINRISQDALVPVIYACGKTIGPIGITSSENLESLNTVSKYLKENTDYDLRQLGNIFDSADIAKSLLDCKGIILVEKYKLSQIRKIEKLLEICKNNNIAVYGAIVVE